MKINIMWGDITDFSAKKKALIVDASDVVSRTKSYPVRIL